MAQAAAQATAAGVKSEPELHYFNSTAIAALGVSAALAFRTVAFLRAQGPVAYHSGLPASVLGIVGIHITERKYRRDGFQSVARASCKPAVEEAAGAAAQRATAAVSSLLETARRTLEQQVASAPVVRDFESRLRAANFALDEMRAIAEEVDLA